MSVFGTVARLWRYPVKSLGGEERGALEVDERGVVGDRLWAVADPDGKLGSCKSTRRFRRMAGLLDLAATLDGQPTPTIQFPDGRQVDADDPMIHEALSGHVGRPVRLQRERLVSHFDEGPLHLVTTAAMAWLEEQHGAPVIPERMRANALIDAGPARHLLEEAWIGQRLELGDEVVIEVQAPMPRCVMVDLPQVGVPPAVGLLETLSDRNDATFGVLADVVRGGTVRIGDQIRSAR